MTPDNALAKIKALAKVSFDNGDSPENVEAAAKQIGMLVMHFPDILDPKQSRSTAPAGRDDGSRDSAGRDTRAEDHGRNREPEDRRSNRNDRQSANGAERSREKKFVTFNHDGIEKQTEKAVCIKINDQNLWIPMGQVESVSKTQITMTEWIANQKHLLDD
jgi:hypothetical protein